MKNKEKGVYIVNQIARLTVLYYTLFWFWQNLAEIINCSKLQWNLWQIAVKNNKNKWVCAKCHGDIL